MNAIRDRIAWCICQFTLKRVATLSYRDRLDGIVRYGMLSAARDEIEGRPAPFAIVVNGEWVMK